MNEGIIVPILVGTILVAILLFFVISFVIQYKRAQDAFELERQNFKRAQLEAENEIQEQTLINLSRDLHDNFGQIASLININLKMIKSDEDSEDFSKLEESKELLGNMIADMRSLSVSLNSDNLKKMGLDGMMSKDVERVNRSGFVSVELKTSEYNNPVDKEKAVFLYRIFQELLNNLIKHAEAKSAEVTLLSNDSVLEIEVRDNGKGMDLKRTSKGSGIQNIKDRAALIGASVDFKSEQGKGTSIKISLPYS